MDLRISVSELSKALTIMQGVVQKKSTMPILSNVLLECSRSPSGEGQLVLSVTDLDVGMRITRPCEVLETGAITASARALLDIVKMLPGPHVSLKCTPNQHLNIRSARTNARLNALAPEEFPRLADVSDVPFYKMDVSVFAAMIQKTLYSASLDENRYNLTGVYFEPQIEQSNKLVMVSTDGHRLSRMQQDFGTAVFTAQRPVILPRKGLTELMRLLENESATEKATFEFAISSNQAIVKTSDTLLSMRLIDGKFPDYHQVIPKLADKIIRASRIDFLTSLRRVAVVASDKAQSVKVTTKKGELTVSCVNPEAGEISDDVPIEYNGPDIEIGFNARYLIEALSSLSDNNVMIKLTDPLSPAMITGIHEDNHLCVIMPMRI